MRLPLIASGLIALALPISALALEGIGPRVTITGTVDSVQISEKQSFSEEGGQLVVTASNGQKVTVVLQDTATIISEGRLSRKQLLPVNIMQGMQVRVRGWRVDSNTISASLVIIMNIELNPVLSLNGTLQAIDGGKITVLSQDGVTRVFNVTNETEINLTYTARGTNGLTLVGKQLLLTLNPLDQTQVRIIRINGDDNSTRTEKPTTVQLKKRE